MTIRRVLLPLLMCSLAAAGSAAAQAPLRTAEAAAMTRPPGVPAPAGSMEQPAFERFFFTPAERTRLDELRRRPAAPPPLAAATPQAPPPPPMPEYVTLNGVVRRSDGTTTVWLNNKPVRGQRTEDGLVVSSAGRNSAPGNVTVRVPQTGRSVDLKVGQQLEIRSGQVQEAYRTQPAPVAIPVPDKTAALEPPAAASPRRSNRERDLLRDLLQEIDGPPAGQPNPHAGSKPPAPTNKAAR